MLPEARGSALVRLASTWGRGGAASADLLEATRGALRGVLPEDLPGAAELVTALLAQLEQADRRNPAQLPPTREVPKLGIREHAG